MCSDVSSFPDAYFQYDNRRVVEGDGVSLKWNTSRACLYFQKHLGH